MMEDLSAGSQALKRGLSTTALATVTPRDGSMTDQRYVPVEAQVKSAGGLKSVPARYMMRRMEIIISLISSVFF